METFDNIILTGRPASGKSELINFLKGIPTEERQEKFHIGKFDEVDDFLWVWELGENDDIWEKMGRERVYTENVGHGYVVDDPELVYTKFMTHKMNEHLKLNYAGDDDYYKDHTLFIEFARGGEEGYQWTLSQFEKEILEPSTIFFLNNSFEESVRRNNARFEEKKKHSILAHKTPDKELYGHYRENDWEKLTGGKSEGYLEIKGIRIPFVTVWNEPEVTDRREVEERFAPALKRLWKVKSEK